MPALYRAEVVGSMLRPAELYKARRGWENGDVSDADLKTIEDRSVEGAIAVQQQAGMDVVTDGEMRRNIFTDSIARAVHGVTRTETPGQRVQWHGGTGAIADKPVNWTLGVTDKVSLKRSLVSEEYRFASALAKVPVKVTLPSPMTLTLLWHPEHSAAVYDEIFDLYEDFASVLRQEIETLVGLGCKYVQVDAPDLAKLVDEEGRNFFENAGASPERILTEGVDLLNSVVTGFADDVTFGMHLCRGNSRGRWRSSGGYDSISSQVFKRATAYDTFLLEYDDERSGGFAPLADLPDDKVAVLGLVTTKRADLETPAELEARIREAAEYFPLEQLALSPQCGFASELDGNPLDADAERAKLKLVADVAHEVWG